MILCYQPVVLPDDPVDNINQPPLAYALTEGLALSGYLPSTALTCSNYGICAKLQSKAVLGVKQSWREKLTEQEKLKAESRKEQSRIRKAK